MNVLGQTRRLWVVAAAPLLAVILIGFLLFAVRSGESQPAAAPSTVHTDVAALPAEPLPVGKPTAPAPAEAAPPGGMANAALPVTEEIDTAEISTAEISTAEIVAIVGDSTITLDDLTEAAAIDAIMARLAGQPSTDAATLLKQLINTEVVLAQAGELVVAQEAAAALEGFLAAHARSYDELVVALATNGVTQPRFERYFARLVSADAYLRRQQTATGVDAAGLLRTWQQEARISFGPIANSILGAVQAPAAATPEIAVAGPVEAVALAEPTAAPAEESPIAATSTALPVPDIDELRGVEIGQLAPEFSLPEFTEGSDPKTLRNLLGAPSVLIFWTTWCPYCLRQTPALVEAHRQWSEQGIQFVGINVKEDASAVEPYVQQNGIDYPVLLDADGATAAAYAVQGYPTTYFLDGNNRIIARHVGALTEEQLNSYLQTLRSAD